jgi:predicted nucleic acid-binding protein
MIFVDSSFIVALFDTTSRYHTRAKLHFESMTGSEEVVVVIDEVAKELFSLNNANYSGQSGLTTFLKDLVDGKLHNMVYKKNTGIDIKKAISTIDEGKYMVSFGGYCMIEQAKKYSSAWILSYLPEMQLMAKAVGLRTLA